MRNPPKNPDDTPGTMPQGNTFLGHRGYVLGGLIFVAVAIGVIVFLIKRIKKSRSPQAEQPDFMPYSSDSAPMTPEPLAPPSVGEAPSPGPASEGAVYGGAVTSKGISNFWRRRKVFLIGIAALVTSVAVVLVALVVFRTTAADITETAREYNDQGLYTEALDEADKAIAKDKAYAPAYVVKAMALVGIGNSADAIESATKAVELDGENPEAYLTRARALLRYGGDANQYCGERAAKDLDEAIKLKKNYAEAYRYRAEAYLVLNKNQSATKDAEKALSLNPKYGQAYAIMGLAYARFNDEEKAIEYCNKAVETSPDDPEVYYLRGLYYSKDEGDYGKAVEDYSKAIDLDPNYADAYAQRGFSNMFSWRNRDQAKADYDKAILMSDSPFPHESRGTAYLLKELYKEAIDDLTRAIEFDPNDTQAYGARASAYISLGELDKALADTVKAVEVFPCADTFASRAEAYYYLDDMANATADISKALELDPDNENAKAVQEQIQGIPVSNNPILYIEPNTGLFSVSVDEHGGSRCYQYPKDPRGAVGEAVISPDRQSIAYTSWRVRKWIECGEERTRGYDGEIWIMGINGDNPHRVRHLLEEGSTLVKLDWTPDGKELVCLEEESNSNQYNLHLYTVDLSGNLGSHAEWAIPGWATSLNLAVSPDGTQVAYLFTFRDWPQEYIYRRICVRTLGQDGFGPEKVLYDKYAGRQVEPYFSNGLCWVSANELAFVETPQTYGLYERYQSVSTRGVLYRINTDTNRVGEIFKFKGGVRVIYGPAISPDHKYLAFICYQSAKDPTAIGETRYKLVYLNLSNHQLATVRELNDSWCSSLNWSSPSEVAGSEEHRGLSNNWAVKTLAIDQAHSTLYAGCSDGDAGVRKKQNGASWTGTGADFNVLSLAFDPVHNILYAGKGIKGHGYGVWKYDGANWTDTGGAISNSSVTALAYDEAHNILYAGCSDNVTGVWKYDGVNWTDTGAPGTPFDGANWTTDRLPENATGRSYVRIFCLAWDGTSLYAGCNDGHVYSKTGEGSWTDTGGVPPDPDLLEPRSYCLAWDGESLYAGCGDGHVYSETGACGWTDTGAPGRGSIYSLAWDGRSLYAGSGDGHVYSKTVSGPWTDTGAPASGVVVNCLAWDGASLYAGSQDGHVYQKIGVGSWIDTGEAAGRQLHFSFPIF